MPNNFPSSLKIGPFIYEIRQTENFATHNSLWGQARPAELVIELEKSIDTEQKWRVLLHEIIHALDELYHLELPDGNKDDVVDRFATVLYAVLVENNLLKTE